MKDWTKCPSVTPGGKPFFYHNRELKFWVAWSRCGDRWAIHRDGEKERYPADRRNFTTATAAMKAAEQLNKKGK